MTEQFMMHQLLMDDAYGTCVATTGKIHCEDGKEIAVSKTMVRTVSYEPWYDGRSYCVYCPELGPFGSVHLTEQEFAEQFCVICTFREDTPSYYPDKHFRLSTHRGGKRRAVHEPVSEPEEEEESNDT